MIGVSPAMIGFLTLILFAAKHCIIPACRLPVAFRQTVLNCVTFKAVAAYNPIPIHFGVLLGSKKARLVNCHSVVMSADKPSPRQKAYLEFMGNRRVDSMTRAEAGAEIERLRNVADGAIPCDPKISGDIGDRMRRWGSEKFRLYPKLYRSEIFEKLELREEEFRRYVRSRIVSASERLTSDRIRSTYESLTDEDPAWWLSAESNELFFDRLQQLYPGCCDGKSPATTNRLTTSVRKVSLPSADVRPDMHSVADRSSARPAAKLPMYLWLVAAALLGGAIVLIKLFH
jgi:hypothetical protein